MARNSACTIYIGNLDEKVSERVLYEILIQVGRVVDLHIPRDKETNRHKGFAFAEYETEETAGYAVRLFSGLVRLHNKTLKFAMSGQDKSTQNIGTSSVVTPVTPKVHTSLPPNPCFVQARESQNTGTPVTTNQNSPLLRNQYFAQARESQNTDTPVTPKLNSPQFPNQYFAQSRETRNAGTPVTPNSYSLQSRSEVNCRFSYGSYSVPPVNPQASPDGLISRGVATSNYEYNRRFIGDMVNNVGHPSTRHPIAYPSY